MIICSKCGVAKANNKFGKNVKNKTNRNDSCKRCTPGTMEYLSQHPAMFETHKLCSLCKECLEVENFYEKSKEGGLRSGCKDCYRKQGLEYINKNETEIKRKGLVYRQNNRKKIRAKCAEYYDNNKEKVAKKSKEYRELNKEKIAKKSKKYRKKTAKAIKTRLDNYYQLNKKEISVKGAEHYENNKERIKNRHKAYHSSLAKYTVHAHKLLPEDKATNENGILSVRCKQCKTNFQPTNSQTASRIVAINHHNLGDGNFYCSEKCKQSCPIYQRRWTTIETKPTAKQVRACTPELKVQAIAQQEAEFGYTYCDRCGNKQKSLDLHHVFPIAEFLENAHNENATLLLCKPCHQGLHSSC